METALYRKYRPKTFDEVVEQSHVVTTLKNQIVSGRVGHAYLFTGSRGTGKTSLAKIFARAVNCEQNKDGNPCNECATCKALLNSDNIDVIEIDAASNNSVQEIRDLREKVMFQPTFARKKVYIIDEVHMLSDSAFNALLKTLEEPPTHVIFILATTDAQKLPATILSRCMRFDLTLLSTEGIYEKIKDIYTKEGKAFEDAALFEISKAGDGSMRDALSIADTCLSASNGKLTYREVVELIGGLGEEKLESLADAVISGDTYNALKLCDEFIKSGKGLTLIAKDLARLFSDLLALKLAGGGSYLSYPKETLERLGTLAQKADKSTLVRGLDSLSLLDTKIRYATYQRGALEAAIVRIAEEKNDFDPIALASRISKLESGAVSTRAAASVPSERAQRAEVRVEDTAKAQIDAAKTLGALINFVRENRNNALFGALSQCEAMSANEKLALVVSNVTAKQFLESGASREIIGAFLKKNGIDEFEIAVAADRSEGLNEELNAVSELIGEDLKIE